MRNHLYQLLAAPHPGGGNGNGTNFDSQGILTWIGENVVIVIIAIVGVVIMLGANKGNYSRESSRVGVLMIGLIVFFGAFALKKFAGDLVDISFS